jgi:hypothetical protein
MTAYLLPLVVGIAFGIALERAGLGNAKKLIGQFYLTDLTVFKVMFSAIVTAMLGLFWLSRLGVIDLASIAIPETYLRPQLAGGLIFGAGFALAGLCPGTSCVSAASGRGDGLAVVAGMFTGVLATGLAFPLLIDFYESDARGAWTLPSLLHLSYGTVVFAIVLVALAGFAAAEWIEGHRVTVRAGLWLAAVPIVLALMATIARTPVNAGVAKAAAARAAAVYRPPSGC